MRSLTRFRVGVNLTQCAICQSRINKSQIVPTCNLPTFWYDLHTSFEQGAWVVTPVQIVRYIAIKRRQSRRTSERSGTRQVLRIAGVLLLAVLLVIMATVASGVGAAVGAYTYFTRDLPEPEQIEAAEENFETTKIYDRSGQILLHEIIDPFGGDRTWVTLDQIPEHLVCATVAIEDRNYWENPGVNLRGIARAFWADIRGQIGRAHV